MFTRTCASSVTNISTCRITNVAIDKRSKDWRGLRPRLLFDTLATELGRWAATNPREMHAWSVTGASMVHSAFPSRFSKPARLRSATLSARGDKTWPKSASERTFRCADNPPHRGLSFLLFQQRTGRTGTYPCRASGALCKVLARADQPCRQLWLSKRRTGGVASLSPAALPVVSGEVE